MCTKRFSSRLILRSTVIPLLGLFVAYGVTTPAYGQVNTGVGPSGQVQAPTVGVIDTLKVDDPTDVWSGGTMVMGGQLIIIPRNLVIDQPANRLTLQQVFAQAPADCLAKGLSGLAADDVCADIDGDGILDCTATQCDGAAASVATLLANRVAGNVIIGDWFMEKGQEFTSGIVSFISYADGYFRINGAPGDDTTGIMIRLNDPEGRHTVQSGAGCDPASTSNCSADPRFTNDPDNYTFTFATGFPACIPSTATGGLRTAGADATTGAGDTFCPQSNRGGDPVSDSRFFAPVQLGDHIGAEGNYETIGGVHFLSAHTLTVHLGLTTADDPNQPDYIIFDEVEYDVAGFQNLRQRILLIGFSTLGNAEVDVYNMHLCPPDQHVEEIIIASTVGCDAVAGVGTCTQQGIPPSQFGIFKIRYDVDFPLAALNLLDGQPPVRARFSPCLHLCNASNASLTVACPCSNPPTIEEEVAILNPVQRDIIGRSRHALNPGVTAFDIQGNAAQSGFYINPTGIGHPEFGEINLNAIFTPFIFSGETWTLGRQFGPGGCVDTDADGIPNCDAGGFLDPFPFSGFDPRTNLPALVADQVLAVCGGAGAETEFFDWSALSTALDGSVIIPPPTTPPPTANAGADQVVLVDEIVQLDGGASTGDITTFAWVQLAGDSVVLGIMQPDLTVLTGGESISNPVFTFPSTPQTLTFELTVTGPDGAGVDTVNVTADDPFNADILTVNRAECRTDKDEWRIQGTSSVPGPGNVVTAYAGDPGIGEVIGSASVDALGDWSIRIRGSSVACTSPISVQSAPLGGVLTNVAVSIR